MRLQADALAVGQREQAVVVHDAVQVLHPHRVHVPVQHKEARLILHMRGLWPLLAVVAHACGRLWTCSQLRACWCVLFHEGCTLL